MTTIYERLNPVIEDSANVAVIQFNQSVQNHMNLMPQLLNDWQEADIGNNQVGGYFQNPVKDVTLNISSDAGSILAFTPITGSTTEITNSLSVVVNTANALYNTVLPTYTYITNRESNVVEIGSDLDTPHYKTATGYGKMMSYLTNQSDGVQNNSTIIAGLTSILIGNSLNELYTTLNTYSQIFRNSITATTTGTGETLVTTYSSNVTSGQAQALYNSIVSINNMIQKHMDSDNVYVQKASAVTTDFSNVHQFNNIGQTEKLLIRDYIGTEKLKINLTSAALTSPTSNVTVTPSTSTSSTVDYYGLLTTTTYQANTALRQSNSAVTFAQQAYNYANSLYLAYSSDENLKENITTISNALDKLKQVSGVMFDWKDEVVKQRGGEDGYFVRKHDTGLIAQQVEKVLPEVVATREDGYKAVRYEKMAGIIIQAINELSEKVDNLEKNIK